MAAIASRYARALVEVILERKIDPDTVRGQLNSIVAAVRESNQLRRVWESPAVSPEQKRAVLDSVAGKIELVKPLRNFTSVLIDHRRIPMLEEIARQVDAELDAQFGFAEGEISSSRELSETEKKEIEAQIERVTGKKVRAHYRSDPDLIGGVIVRVGSTIYDGSVRGQLEKLRQELSTA